MRHTVGSLSDTPGDPAPRDRRRRTLMGVAVVATAAIGVAITAVTDRLDSALLFVGLPALLAIGITLRPPARSFHGAVASGTTFALLLAAILLQEGAICVLLSAPLVFAVTHGIAAASRRLPRSYQAGVLLPLVALASLEGLAPGVRIAPVQTVDASAVVAAEVTDVAERLAEGPELATARRPLLLRTGMPVPASAAGDGLSIGDTWTFDYRGAPIITEVTDRTDHLDGSGQVTFGLLHDGSKTSRWLTWQDATLRWAPADEGTTEVDVVIRFERGLDPSWWFGPVEDAFVGAGASYLLDGLVGDLDTATTTGASSVGDLP